MWAPRTRGGFGIEPQPLGESWSIKPPVPKLELGEIGIVTNQNEWRATKLTEYGVERYGRALSKENADKAAHDGLLSTIASDNVPRVASDARRSWLSRVRRARCRAELERTDTKMDVTPPILDGYSPEEVGPMLDALQARAPLFGANPEVAISRKDHALYGGELGFRRWLEIYFPKIDQNMRVFHKSWHMSEKLDYLEGSFPVPMGVVNPALTHVVQTVAAAALSPKVRVGRNSVGWVVAVAEEIVAKSSLSQRLYWW